MFFGRCETWFVDFGRSWFFDLVGRPGKIRLGSNVDNILKSNFKRFFSCVSIAKSIKACINLITVYTIIKAIISADGLRRRIKINNKINN